MLPDVRSSYHPPAGWQQLLEVRHHVRGQIVRAPGDMSALYIVKDGRVRLYRLTPDGREVTLRTVRTGDVFGVLGSDRPDETFAEAVQDTAAWVVDEPALHRVVAATPGVVIDLLSQLSARLSVAEARVVELAFASAPQRVARALLRRCDDRAGVLRMTQSELGKDAAVARETVSKVLSDLDGDGVITTRRGMVGVIDVPALRARAWPHLVSEAARRAPTGPPRAPVR